MNERKKKIEFARTSLNMSEPISGHHKPLRMHADFDVGRPPSLPAVAGDLSELAFSVAAGVLATPKL